MQLRLPWTPAKAKGGSREIDIGGQAFAVEILRRRGARRFVVRVTPDAVVRITVPYGARIAAGLAFAERHADWIARQWERQQERNKPWAPGSQTWFRGERVRIEASDSRLRFADQDAGPAGAGIDLKQAVLRHMRSLADAELPARCRELADAAGRVVARVSVRNQRSRWGACSSRGTITLNWRLIQVPPAVRDYIIHHELAHLTVPNHSRAFWREVEGLCDTWRDSERWLKQHGREFF